MTTPQSEEAPEAWWLPYRRRWVLIASACAIFLVTALVVSLLRPPVFVAEARLAVGSGQMTALNIPGFPTASEQMASNYARWVRQQGTQGKGVPPGTLTLNASPIVESNVLRIEATSHDAQIARTAAAQAAEQLTDAVNTVRAENDPSALIAKIESNVEPLERARERADRMKKNYEDAAAGDRESPRTARLFNDYIDAEQDLVKQELVQDGLRDRYRNLIATRSTEADLVSVQPAGVVGSDRMAVAQRNALLALIAGLVVGGGIVRILEGRERRVRRATSAGALEEGE